MILIVIITMNYYDYDYDYDDDEMKYTLLRVWTLGWPKSREPPN